VKIASQHPRVAIYPNRPELVNPAKVGFEDTIGKKIKLPKIAERAAK
jgi:hypothetical protein